MALKLLAQGPLAAGGPVPLSEPKLLAVVVGAPISLTPGTYTEPVQTIHHVFRDGRSLGELPYTPVVSDEGRRFVVLETATGTRGFAQQTSEELRGVRRPVFVEDPSFEPEAATVGQEITFDLGDAPEAELTVDYLTLDGVDDTENLTL